MQNSIFMKMNQPHCSVEILHQRRATFNPVPAVQILHAVNHLDFRPMNVPADYAMHILLASHQRDGLLVIGSVFDSLFCFELEIRRNRPVTETQTPSNTVENKVQVENPVVKPRTDPV